MASRCYPFLHPKNFDASKPTVCGTKLCPVCLQCHRPGRLTIDTMTQATICTFILVSLSQLDPRPEPRPITSSRACFRVMRPWECKKWARPVAYTAAFKKDLEIVWHRAIGSYIHTTHCTDSTKRDFCSYCHHKREHNDDFGATVASFTVLGSLETLSFA